MQRAGVGNFLRRVARAVDVCGEHVPWVRRRGAALLEVEMQLDSLAPLPRVLVVRERFEQLNERDDRRLVVAAMKLVEERVPVRRRVEEPVPSPAAADRRLLLRIE